MNPNDKIKQEVLKVIDEQEEEFPIEIQEVD